MARVRRLSEMVRKWGLLEGLCVPWEANNEGAGWGLPRLRSPRKLSWRFVVLARVCL